MQGIDGGEGVGKSVLAQQIGKYLDPSLILERITFTPKEFRDAVLKANKFQSIIFDEAFTGLASRRTMSSVNLILVEMMAEIRQKNLIIILVLPSFFDMDKYAAIHRTRCLIHVYTKNFKRGFFKFYSYSDKKKLYLFGKKSYNYNAARPSFNGRFTDFYVVNKQSYQDKKLKALHDKIRNTEESPLTNRETEYKHAIQILIEYFTPVELHKLSEKLGKVKDYFRRFRYKKKKVPSVFDDEV